jgi:hypothetical protein
VVHQINISRGKICTYQVWILVKPTGKDDVLRNRADGAPDNIGEPAAVGLGDGELSMAKLNFKDIVQLLEDQNTSKTMARNTLTKNK